MSSKNGTSQKEVSKSNTELYAHFLFRRTLNSFRGRGQRKVRKKILNGAKFRVKSGWKPIKSFCQTGTTNKVSFNERDHQTASKSKQG